MSFLNPVIAQALYMLKRSYGAPISIYIQGAATADTRTGNRAVAKTAFPVDVAIVLPAKLSRNDKRSISVISANKQIVQGGFYDTTQRTFIIDRSDVPELEMLTENDWIVFKGRKYQFVEVQELEDDAAWVITGKAVIGERPEQIFLASADNLLSFDQTLSSFFARNVLESAAGDLTFADAAEVTLVLSRDVSHALAFVDGAEGTQIHPVLGSGSGTLAFADVAQASLVLNREVSHNLALSDEASAALALIISRSVSHDLALSHSATGVAVDETFKLFYGWQNPANSHYEIWRIRTDGTSDTFVIDTGTSVLQALAYDRINDFIFYGRNNGTVRKVKPDGTGDVAVASGFGVIIALTVDPANNRMWVYDRTTNFIQQMTLAGGSLTNLTAESYAQVRTIAYEQSTNSLFWSNTTQVRRYALTGGTVSTLFNPGSTDVFSTAIINDGDTIYHTLGNFIRKNNYAGTTPSSFDVADASGPFYLFYHPLEGKLLYTVAVDLTTASIRKINTDGTGIVTITTKSGLDNGLISALAAG